MSKVLGATTFGAIVLTGFLFQAKYGASPVAGQQNTAPRSQSATKPLPGEGPYTYFDINAQTADGFDEALYWCNVTIIGTPL